MFSRLSFKDCNCLLGKNICYKQVGSEIKQSQIKSDTSHKRLNFRKERKSKCFLLEKRKSKNLHKCFKNCMWQVEVSSPKKAQVKLHLYPESLSESQEDTKQRPFKTRMTLLTPSPSVPSHYTAQLWDHCSSGDRGHRSLHLLYPMNWAPPSGEYAASIRRHVNRTLCHRNRTFLFRWRYHQRSI